MTRRDTIPGAKVVHSVFRHWGLGVVKDYRTKDGLGFPTPCKVLVEWDKLGSGPKYAVWTRLSDLRKVK